MKEIFSAVIFLVSVYSGTIALREIHAGIRRVALEKAAQGLPSLSGLAHKLQQRPKGKADNSKEYQ